MTCNFDMIVFRLMIADKVIIELLFRPIGARIGEIVFIQDRCFPTLRSRRLKIANGQVIEMYMSVGAVKGFHIKANFSRRVISICQMTDKLVVDMKKEIG